MKELLRQLYPLIQEVNIEVIKDPEFDDRAATRLQEDVEFCLTDGDHLSIIAALARELQREIGAYLLEAEALEPRHRTGGTCPSAR